MTFTTLYFRSGRIATGAFELVRINETSFFVGVPDVTDAAATPRGLPSARIAAPVGSIEFAMPAESRPVCIFAAPSGRRCARLAGHEGAHSPAVEVTA